MTWKGLFTTAAGAPVADNTNIMKAGQRGPAGSGAGVTAAFRIDAAVATE
jgi:hypothetical protein